MFIQSLLQTCASRGLMISYDPEKGLHVQFPQGALTEALRAELKHHKPDIINFLKSSQCLVASLGSESGEYPTVATLATDLQCSFLQKAGVLEENYKNNPGILVAGVASLGSEFGGDPTVATLATDLQRSFLQKAGVLEENHKNNPGILVASLGNKSGDDPTVATLATDLQGSFLQKAGALEENHKNNPGILVASLGNESGDDPTVATLATDLQHSFLQNEAFHDYEYEEERLIRIRSLIKKYVDLGITLTLDLERGIHVKTPPGALTPILRQELTHYKQDIINFLKNPKNLVASVATLGNRKLEEHLVCPSLGSVSVNTPTEVTYRLITDITEAKECLDDLVAKGEVVGLDLETTGLFPHEGAKARLLQVSAKDGPVLVIDLFQVGGLRALKEQLKNIKAVAHNAIFEMKFLKSEGVLLTLDCTLLANHILTGKMSKLSDLCQQHLGVDMDKTLQISDWGGDLTSDQLKYAAADAYYTRLLFSNIQTLLEKDGGDRVYTVCKQAQQAVVDMELAGMPFDAEAHKALLEKLVRDRDSYQSRLTEEMGTLNLNSGKQLGEWLTQILGGNTSPSFKKWPRTDKGQLATSEKDFRTSLKLLPEEAQELVIECFLPYKTLEKQITSFGETLLKSVSKDTGRIHANFKMTGTKTGRFSCSNPNLQQIPRDKVFRALFKAPEGRTFVIADYSQMELRVAAIVANEEKLLEAYRQGKDTHAITAGMLLNKEPEEVTKQERQLAKAVNFGLLYGQGAKGLKDYASGSYGVEISEEEAKKYREAWFKAYPTFATWHRVEGANSKARMMVTTPLGRKRRFVSYKDKDFYSATKAYNTPIQGGAAEVMLAALGKLSNLLSSLDAKPIAVIHDEVIVEASIKDAPKVITALEGAMIQGMLDVFPQASTLGLVEANIADSWADK